MTCSPCVYILFKCIDTLYAIHKFIHGARMAQRFSPHATCLLVCLSSIPQQVSRSAFSSVGSFHFFLLITLFMGMIGVVQLISRM